MQCFHIIQKYGFVFSFIFILNINMKSNKIPTRICENCTATLTYTNKSNYNAAVKRNDICRNCGIKASENKRKSTLSILLEDTPITYYWIGFLLADGNFGKTNTVKCTLSSVDKNHLKNLQKFLNIKSLNFEKNEAYCTIKAMDTHFVPEICKKFNISNTKTYNPPNLEFIKDNDLLLSLIIGFIDGDGCIAKKNKAFSLTVKCHSSWLNNLDFFAKKINKTSNAKINNAGYAYFSVTNVDALKTLKTKSIELNLPTLNRKWSKIDLDYVKHKEAYERNFITFEKLFNKFKNFDHFKERFNKLIYEK